MASKYSIETIFSAFDKFSNPVKKMESVGKSFSRTLKTDFAKAQRQFDKFGQGLQKWTQRGVLLLSGAITAGLAYAMKEGIQLASDLTEVQNVVDTTFRESSGIINEWSKNALNQFGLSQLQAKKFTGTLGAMGKGAGMSGEALNNMAMDLTGLAGDYASFYNLNIEEAFNKIRSGIAGESEPLKQIGKDMSVAGLKAFAMASGIKKSYEAMNMAEKYQLRYAYLISQSKDQIGDFNKTLSTSWANQIRLIKTKFAEKLATAMSKLLPMLIEGGKWLNNLLDKIDAEKLADNIAKGATALFNFGKGLFAVFNFLKPLLPIILGLIIAFKMYHIVMMIAVAAQWAMNIALTMNPIGLIIVGIGLLIGIIITMIIYWKQIVIWVKMAWTEFFKWYDILKGVAIILGGPMAFAIIFLIDLVRNIIKYWGYMTNAFKSDGIIGGLIAIGKVILSTLLSPIESLLNLLGKIPGVGAMFKEWGMNIGNFREGMFANKDQSPISPAEKSAYIKEEKISKGELTIKDKTGTAEMTKKPTINNYNLKLQKSGTY